MAVFYIYSSITNSTAGLFSVLSFFGLFLRQRLFSFFVSTSLTLSGSSVNSNVKDSSLFCCGSSSETIESCLKRPSSSFRIFFSSIFSWFRSLRIFSAVFSRSLSTWAPEPSFITFRKRTLVSDSSSAIMNSLFLAPRALL